MAQATDDNITSPTQLRGRMVEAIERLLTALDALEADPDLENDGTEDEDADADDPTRIEGQNCASDVANRTLGLDDSEEDDHAEEDDPGGGDINDEPHNDDDPDEPSLGALADDGEPRSQLRWASGGVSDCEDDPGNVGEEGWPISGATRTLMWKGSQEAADALREKHGVRVRPSGFYNRIRVIS